MLKKLITALIIIIAIPLIVALFTPKEYAVEREITVSKPKEVVFDYVKYLGNQDNFSKWATMDPDMKKSFRGTDGTVGFVSAWESEKDDVGTGEQEITAIQDGERIEYEIRFLKPMESTSPAYMATSALADDQTKVVWGFNGKMPYPMNLMLLFMDFEQMIGDDFQFGLEGLKAILEEMPEEMPDEFGGEDVENVEETDEEVDTGEVSEN